MLQVARADAYVAKMVQEGEEMAAMLTRIDENCNMGYALMSFGNDNDNGQGPNLIRGDDLFNDRKVWQDELKAMHVELVEGSKLQPKAFQHAMSVVVNPKAIDKSSLTFSSKSKDHQTVKWMPEYVNADDTAWLSDGNHRVEYLREYVLKPHQEILSKAQEDLVKLREGLVPDPSKIERITKVINTCHRTISKRSLWLVHFYDLGMLLVVVHLKS